MQNYLLLCFGLLALIWAVKAISDTVPQKDCYAMKQGLRTFKWTIKRFIFLIRWEAGQPDNANNNENCLAVSVSTESALLRDENCDAKFKYICEA